MAIVVRYKPNGKRYVVVGTGYGAFQSSRPSALLGELAPVEKRGQLTMVAVCGPDGVIGWARSEDVEVVEIDGKPPAEIIG